MNEFIPSEFFLSQNYPNPFKEKTIIKYCVAYKSRVQIVVYDSKGKLIEKLVDEEKKPGTYEVSFQSTVGNRQLANGIYSYSLKAGDYKFEKKMTIQK